MNARKSKKILTTLAALIMAVVTAVCAMAVPVYADSIFDTAQNIDSGKKVSTTLDNGEAMDYKITPAEKGTASVKITAKSQYFSVYIYDEDGSKISFENKITMGSFNQYNSKHYWDDTAETFKGTVSFDVKAGKTYYIKIERGSYASGSGKFEVSFNYPSGESAPSALMTVTLKKGDTVQLGANGSNASWSSSDKSVASVSKSGLVKAVKKGRAVITLKCGSKTESIEVIVE